MATTDTSIPTSSLVDEQESSLQEQALPSKSLDDLFEAILGDFGFSQLIQSVLVSLPSFFDAQQTFISIFTDLDPKWHCTNSTICNSTSNICHLPKSAWTWDAPTHKSTISEWDLHCSSSFIQGLPASSYFVGCLVGGFFLATLGDSSLGRKNLLCLSSLVMSTFALATAFSTNVWIYSALRFISGLGRASIATTALVLLMERIQKRWRSKLGMMVFFSFTFGTLSLPAIAYSNEASSWRKLYLWTSVPAIVYSFAAYILIHESPRWLILQGRLQEAKKILSRFAAKNLDLLDSYSTNTLQDQEASKKVSQYASMKMLFKKGWSLRRILAAMPIGFGIGVMYFGILLGIGNLGFNIYLSVTFNALLLIPSLLLTFFFIETWNRKFTLLAFCVVSGCCSIICVFVKNSTKGVQIGLVLAAFFCASLGFTVVMIYTSELFPTCIRNSATSMVRQAMVFGSVFVPTLISVGKKNELLSNGVFGLTIIVCGLFVVTLPETRGTSLCDSMDEQEHKDNTILCKEMEV